PREIGRLAVRPIRTSSRPRRAATAVAVLATRLRRPAAGKPRAGEGDQPSDGQYVDPDRAVAAAGRESRAVGAEGDGGQEAGVPRQRQDVLAGAQVPELGGRVLAPGDEEPAVRAEGERVDIALVGGERPDHAMRGDVPEDDRTVGVADGEDPAGRVEGDALRLAADPCHEGAGCVETEERRLSLVEVDAVLPVRARDVDLRGEAAPGHEVDSRVDRGRVRR